MIFGWENYDYDTVKTCFGGGVCITGAVFKQLKELKVTKHPRNANGKEKRSSTGSSSERSSYPIPEAQDYQSQPGDIRLVFPCLVWSIESWTEPKETKFETELRGKNPVK